VLPFISPYKTNVNAIDLPVVDMVESTFALFTVSAAIFALLTAPAANLAVVIASNQQLYAVVIIPSEISLEVSATLAGSLPIYPIT
jgi:hypothetical protein